MSKMGNEFIRDAESHSLDNAHEVARLRAVVAKAREMLDEGDPAGTLRRTARGLWDTGWVGKADDLRAVADVIDAVINFLDRSEVSEP